MKNYLISFFEEFEYPEEGAAELLRAYGALCGNADCNAIIDEILTAYDRECTLSGIDLIPKCNELAELSGVHEYTVKLLVHILLSRKLRELYAEKGLDGSLWFSAMSDLKYKLIECRIVKGVWGTFVADWKWFARWYDLTRFAFRRLQFEVITFKKEYEKNGVRLTPESKVLNVHIPRTGTPLDHGEVLESYRMAREFYKDEFGDEPIAFVCSSWLLYPEHEKILHERSNIRKFMSDYDIIDGNVYPEENKSALWRIFDCPVTDSIDDLPEDSFLKKAYKQFLKNGGKLGFGFGIIV